MIDGLLSGKRVRIKALLILLAGFVVLGVGVHFLHAFQVKRNARDLYEQAVQFKKEGQLANSVNALEQYLGLAPNDTNALATLGEWLIVDTKTAYRNRIRAFLVLNQVLRREPMRADIRRNVADLAIKLGEINAAREHLTLLLQSNPDDAELLHWSGRCETAAKQWDKARDWYRKAVKIAPKRVELSVDYAVMERKGMMAPDVADRIIENLVKADPKAVNACLQAARYYYAFEVFDKAEKHLRAVFDKSTVITEETFALAAELALAQGKIEEGRRYLEQGRSKYPLDSQLTQALARLELFSGRRKEALAILEPSLTKLPDNPDELSALAKLLIETGGKDEAELVIERLAKKYPGPQVDCLKAYVLMRKESWGLASKDLEKAVAKIKPGTPLSEEAYLKMAECYQRLDNPDMWLDACRRLVDNQPRSQYGRRALAEALTAQGKIDQALKEYQQLKKLTPDVQRQIARLLLLRNLQKDAKERRWDGIEQLLKELAAEKPEKFETTLLRANILAAQEKFSEAKAEMEKERDRDPKKIGPWLFLAQLAELQESPLSAQLLLGQAEKVVGKNVELQMARARLAAVQGDPIAAKELALLETTIGDFVPAEADSLRAVLAAAHAALNHGAHAERLWIEQAKRQEYNLSVRLHLLERFYKQEDDTALKRVVDEIRQIEGGAGPITAYGEAARCMLQFKTGTKGALEESRTWLAKAAVLRPTWSRISLLEAETFEVENRKERALEKYKAALDRGENRLWVIRRTLQLMYDQQLYKDASTLMAKLPTQAVEDAGLERLAAQLLLVNSSENGVDQKKARLQALELAHKSVKADSKDYQGYLWLGQVAVLADKMGEAESAFRRARDLNDTIPDTWAALILHLVRTTPLKAEIELGNARSKLPADKAPLVFAPAYEALGKLDLAEKQYEAAMALKPSDPIGHRNLAAFLVRSGQAAKAESSLRKLLEPQSAASKDTLAWTRRTLAVTLVSQGGYQRFKEAQQVLEENLKHGETLEDRLVKAIVLTTQPAHRKEAIRLCEELGSKQSAALPDVQFFLAQLHEADGNWRLAKDHFVLLLGTQDKNPIFLAHFVRALLRHDEMQEAQAVVDRLESVVKGAWTGVELRARVLHARDKKDNKAKELVLDYAKKKDARLDLAGLLLDELGHSAAAEKTLRDHIASSKRPESQLLLIQYFAKHQRVAEALTLCEQAWKDCPPALAAHASVILVRTGKASVEQQTQIEGWFKKGIAADAKNVMLKVFLAEFEFSRGNDAAATSIYRRMLQTDKENIVALNNLAFLLALKKENLTESLNLIENAIALAGPQAQLLDSKAVVLLQQGQPQLAIQELQKAIAQGASAEFYFHLALAQHQANNRPAALEALRKARAAGIQVEQLHPLEQPMFQLLVKELG